MHNHSVYLLWGMSNTKILHNGSCQKFSLENMREGAVLCHRVHNFTNFHPMCCEKKFYNKYINCHIVFYMLLITCNVELRLTSYQYN